MTVMTCCRCGKERDRLDAPPMPGPLGQEVQDRVCHSCWAEWQQMEVMVINELKLNFMDPGAQAELDRQMREFLVMPPGSDEVT